MKGIIIVMAGIATSTALAAQPRPPESEAVQSAGPVDPAAAVAEVRKLIAERYVLPERRPALDAVLADGLKSGRYAVRDPALLAQRINADLTRVGRDHHLNFKYDPKRPPGMRPGGSAGPGRAAMEQQVRLANHGVRDLKLLHGNVRYLDLASFDWIGEESAAALGAAMAFLKGGDAVIIDLRRNGGGSSAAVHHLISHFLEPERPLITFHRGKESSPLLKVKPGLSSMVGKPLYVLTSGGSASAAEEFVGHVAGYRIGEIVGATTAGAAFNNAFYAVKGGFHLSVSEGRPVLASTGKDWEGVGIAPTLPTPVEAALEAAHVHALRKLAAAADPARRSRLEGLARGLEAIGRPGTADAAPAAYAGAYGDRRVFVEDGKLWYQLEKRPRSLLVPLGGHRFTTADDPLMRMTFTAAGDRITGLDIGLGEEPPVGRYERTG